IRNAKVTSSIPVSGTKNSAGNQGLYVKACSPFFLPEHSCLPAIQAPSLSHRYSHISKHSPENDRLKVA
ncbi:hypothetical protein, partial [Massilia sp.]|uniref:hypothetical protein n=1 Tax=Massilia sp. TaxID=1882437 RepID=UPI0028AF5EE1